MVRLDELSKETKIPIFKLEEERWVNPHPGLLAHGVDEKKDQEYISYGHFSSVDKAMKEREKLQEQRFREGYSSAKGPGDEQTRISRNNAEELECLYFSVKVVNVPITDISEKDGKAYYCGCEIQ